MAGIDKIYGSPKQWDEMRDWLRMNRPELVRFMYLRPSDEEGPLSNFPHDVDCWLWQQPNLPQFIRARLSEQYTDPEKRLGSTSSAEPT